MAKKKGKREEGFTFPEFDKDEFRQKELRDSKVILFAVFSTDFGGRTETKQNPVVDEIKKMDLMNLTPLQALEKLHEIQQKLL